MAGIIRTSDISGSLDAKNIAMGVLTKALDISNLVQIAQVVEVPELKATIPVMTPAAGNEDLGEWEYTTIESGDFSNVEFNLRKDRVKVGVSDESRYRSGAGDPLSLQEASAAARLAYLLDKKIVTALQTNPQTSATGGAWSTVTNNPLIDLATACANIGPYTADYCIMPRNVWAKFVGNNYTSQFIQGNPEKLTGVLTTIPGLNLKVFVNDNVTAKSVIVGASAAPSVAVGNGPVKVRREDSMNGGEIYQIDVFRQAVAPILKNAISKNMAAYQVTGVIA